MKIYYQIVTAFWFTVIAILLIVFLTGCAGGYKCYPSKRSKDYATRTWMKQRSDGYWLVTVQRGFKDQKTFLFECKPDSINVDSLFKG